MTILAGVIGLFAVLSFVVAALQAMQIVRLAPKGERLGSYFALGWWKFNKIEAMAGPASAPHLQIYKRAVAAFLVFVILGVVLSGFAVSQAPATAGATGVSYRLNEPQAVPAEFAFNSDFRRVASMPGTTFLES